MGKYFNHLDPFILLVLNCNSYQGSLEASCFCVVSLVRCICSVNSLFSFPPIITFLTLTAEFITTHNPGLSGNRKAVASLPSSRSHSVSWIYGMFRSLQLQEAGNYENEIRWTTITSQSHLNRSTLQWMLLAGNRRWS